MTNPTLVEQLRAVAAELEHAQTWGIASLCEEAVAKLREAADALTGQEGAAPSPQSNDEKNAGLLGSAAGKSGDGSTPRRED